MKNGMIKKDYENYFYPIDGNKNEYFYFVGSSFCFAYCNKYLEMYATIYEEDLPAFASFLNTSVDFQEIYDAAKIKLKGMEIDGFKILLKANNINFRSAFFRS